MLIHPWDAAAEDEWRDLLERASFGQVIAAGGGDGYPTVVPSHFVYDGAEQIWLHLARPNPVWRAIEENPRVVFSVIADYTYVEAAWNAETGTPPEHGVPTSYYSAVQFRCVAEIVDDPGEKITILRRQLGHLEPADSTRVPPSWDIDSDRRLLPGIRGLRLTIDSVLAKMKYGGNRTAAKREEIAERLAQRNGPMDHAARQHLLRRSS
ncbi:MAG: FMN-binding negative transcriptional regulator [Nocardioidaceae bacterium]